MSLIFATQLTAVATTVLAAFAVITAGFAGAAFYKQTLEVSILQQQMQDQRGVLELQTQEPRSP